MKRHIPTFEQFVNEAANDANGFDPAKAQDTDPTMSAIKTVAELLPGKEYVITLDGVKNTDMVYAGVTDGYYIFNEEDHNAEPKTFTKEAISKVIAAGGVSQVAE
jgi:hypothetical protein